MRMNRVLSALSLFFLAGTALADPPAALDRVPKDAVVVVGVRSVGDSLKKVEQYTKTFGVPTGPLAQVGMLVDSAGFNKGGSAAFGMVGDPNSPDFDPEQSGFMIVPVSDLAKFVEAFGGKLEGKMGTMPKISPDASIMDIGGGFAVMGPAATIKSYTSVEGQMAAHKAALGKAGNRIADQADVLVVSNLEKFSQKMLEGVEEMKGGLEMLGQMAGAQNPDAEKLFKQFGDTAEQFAKEVKTGIAGVTVNDAGVSLDFAAQFKEGSGMNKLMQHEGKAAQSAAGLPGVPFLFAGGIDTTNPVVRNIVSAASAMQQGMGMNLAKGIDKMQNQSFLIGANPALLSTGIFAKTVLHVKTSDPAGLVSSQRQAIEDLPKAAKDTGIKYDLKYTPEASEIGGIKVDRWKAKIDIDPDSPAAQMQQFMAIFTGTSGEMGGMIAKTPTGVVSTMSINTEMMTKALDAANGKGALSADAGFASVASQLPADRTAEVYLGVKGIFDTVKGVASSFNADIPFAITEELPPIGMALSTSGGGISFRIHAPAKVLEAAGKIVKDLNGGAEGDPAPAEGEKKEDRRKPRF